jgi:uncharacterized lipoprotein YddW (UPF0748 family)
MLLESVLLVALGAAANDQVIDAFQYPDTAAARQAWQSSSGTPPVEVVRDGDRGVLELTAPFATDPKMPRTIIDRNVKLDLTVPGEIQLRLSAEKPECVGHVTLYFHSGQGWYGAGQGLRTTGLQTLTFSKADFTSEGSPAGWDQVDGVRISIWRGQAVDSRIRLSSLAAKWHDVAVVVPTARSGDGEIDSALSTAGSVAAMLAELGLGSDAVDEEAVLRGGLAGRRVAVLAYHPRLGREAAERIARFVTDGGKLFACYSIPSQLARLLGLEEMKYVRPDRPGGFSEIRFDADDVPGLPKSVRQASWNITAPQKLAAGTEVIGTWVDDQGNPTGQPALLMNEHGAFLTHIVLGDDRQGKKQMLAAVLGRLDPALWATMARYELDRVGPVGHLQTLAEATEHVRQSGNAAAMGRLDESEIAQHAAHDLFARRDFAGATARARQAQELLAEAYLRAGNSPPREGRAFWNHSGTGAYDGDWERTAKELAAGGFNMVLPNMLWAGRAHYPSDVLPRSSTFDRYGDQIAQCLDACHRHGVEVHVWKVNWNLSGAPREFAEKLRSQGRTQVSNTGDPIDWLCPSDPDNFELELESMLEVARKYDVDGLHFDYIRYPGRSGCYCDGCRERFEADSGLSVANWPKDCHSGPLADRYTEWRCRQITRLVAAVHDEAKKIRPGLKISAAVFGSYPDCRQSIGQDWVAWAKAGYLDFLCPMDYTESDLSFTNLVTNQLKLVGGRVPIYPGIGATASRATLSADRVAGQVHLARRLGAAGFTVFNLQPGTAAEILPGLALGTTSRPAVPPHRD